MLTKTIIENILIIVAEAFWVSSCWTQLRRLVKTHNPKGLSAPSQTLNAAGNIAWATYFFSRGLFVPVITNLTMMLITLGTLFYILGNKKQFVKGIVAIAIVGPITSYILIVHPSVAGWLGVAYNLIAATPWVLHVVITKKVSGISERSFYFSLSAMLCTLTYALLIVSIPLIVGCLLGLAYTSVIMGYYYKYRKHD